MFFDIESDLDDKRYVTLMFILNASEDEARLGIEIETLRQSLRTFCAIELSFDDMLAMYVQGLISYWEADGKPTYSQNVRDQDWVGLDVQRHGSPNQFLRQIFGSCGQRI